MSDKIYIRDLAMRCIIGIFPEERVAKQDVVLNLVLTCGSFKQAAESDDIADAVDYKGITKQIIQLVEKSDYFLIKRMAEEIAQVVLEHPGVQDVRVTVDKPGALRFARSVAVEIQRSRAD